MNRIRKIDPPQLFPVPKPEERPARWQAVRERSLEAFLSVTMVVSAALAVWYLTPLHHLVKH